ncbi:hypothetical protein SCUCBS95973_003980 [Sporothrix curviconia]|uniref:Xylanolytic transcriptional activator regulatory domain-containing protein n=1 Tax=Sporothrix curviconia TaxID=1260050 RepID=A0ABP0BK04_9PEZI
MTSVAQPVTATSPKSASQADMPKRRRASLKEVVESDEDNGTRATDLAQPPAPTTDMAPWAPTPAVEAAHKPSLDNGIPPFEWNDVLDSGLPLAATIAPAQSLASLPLSDATTNDVVSYVPSVTSDSSLSHSSVGDNILGDGGVCDNDTSSHNNRTSHANHDIDGNLANFEMLIEKSIEDDESTEHVSPDETAQSIEHEIVQQAQKEDEPMSYELLSHAVDSFALYGAGPNGINLSTDVTTDTGVEFTGAGGYASSEAWQRMHFPFSPSLFTSANANMFTMPFAAAVDSIASWSNGDSHGSSATTPQPEPQATENASTPPTASTGIPASAFVIFSRYPFLSSCALWKLDHEDDAMLLEQRGCLHVPNKPILDEIMKQYFLHVHPMVPLLNELDFWTMYNSPAPLSAPFCQMPLFLFQCMLFIVCPFVSQETLAKLNFSSVPEARANFYRRAKMLFHLEEGRDDISTAQGAFMLTYQSSSMKDRTSNYWLNVSIHYARNAHAHRYFDLKSAHARRRTVLKRLWWCCVLRDKVVSLGMRRPMHIGPTDFDTQRPGLNEQDTCEEFSSSPVFSPASKRALSHVFARLCELAGILTDVLDICYPASGKSLRVADASVAQDYVAKLDAWYKSAAAQYKASMERAGNEESLLLFVNAAYIYY